MKSVQLGVIQTAWRKNNMIHKHSLLHQTQSHEIFAIYTLRLIPSINPHEILIESLKISLT
jgi:hypothetical protein